VHLLQSVGSLSYNDGGKALLMHPRQHVRGDIQRLTTPVLDTLCAGDRRERVEQITMHCVAVRVRFQILL
jgi:hypothetical protein